MNGLHEDATVDVVDAEGDTVNVVVSGVVVHADAARPVLPGRYEDLGEIARGAFGEVRRVRDTLLDRVVAMKVLHAEHADVEHVRRRFLTEVRITAQLQHPGIVAVHDRGELSDGRLWFTMKEIRGRTLHEVIDELHDASDARGFGTTTSGWTFRRLVDAFTRIVQAVAYAHRQGIVHRDLKPENLMVGEFGEVLVMDWGLARRVGPTESPAGGVFQDDQTPGLTQHGDILGTPAYMSPEQARGALALHGPASDVYALGAVLYCLLAGKPPYEGASSRDVLMAVLRGPPKAVRDAARMPLPNELCVICEHAMHRDITERFPNAASLWNELVAWLDGVRLREQALEALAQARTYEPEITRLRSEENLARGKARALQNDLRPFDPVEKKRPAWDLEDEASRLGRMAALAETKWLEAVHGALSIDPRLPEAHLLLSDHYRNRLVEAELEHRDEDAARAEELLRIHDQGKHAAFLRGDGRLTLVTDPPGAEVFVDRYVLQDRRLVAMPEGLLGQTPLVEVPLQRGSYLLRLRAPSRAEVRYPVLIERDGHWDGVAPGDREPFPIYLPNENELGPDDVYVPAGYSWIGGDPEAADGLPRRRVWLDGFVMRRFPVTAGEYLDFLNDLVENDRVAEAMQRCPRTHQALLEQGVERAFLRDASGRFSLPPDREGFRWRRDWPVVVVDWFDAMAYASWLSARTEKPWRLPNELEREKAARGVDGRFLPWGNHMDPTFANVVDTSAAEATRGSVFDQPFDESVYGVRGLAGNTRDWCINLWKHEGPSIVQNRATLDEAARDDPDFRVIKGGSWSTTMVQSRAAARFGGRPAIRRPVVGFRLVRRLR
ncbi:MAG: SUMF1/EgtB/PvdO family nonheme iron enzyme [Polyangiaceae bacterium]|nr:SUMF1/EgtB/PvdO family nonheme iron enzyme [Polyangiaceae bacterium]